MNGTIDPTERLVAPVPSSRRPVLVWSAIIILSVALHALVLAALLFAPGRHEAPAPELIAVEVVPPPAPAPASDAPSQPKTEAAPAPATPAKTDPAEAPAPSTSHPVSPPKPSTMGAPVEPPAPEVPTPTSPPGIAAAPSPPPPPPPTTGFEGMPATFRAVALPAATIGGAEAASYKAIVFGRLAAAKRYPEGARARGAAGSAVVAFSLDRSGRLQRASLLRSSGDADLDAEALATVARCDPFPPPPQGAQTSFAAGIEFGLDP